MKPTLNSTGSNFFSRYRDHQGSKFTSSTERFRTLTLDSPGPGNHNSSTIEINPQGRYSLSKLQNAKVRSFGNAKRKSLNERSQSNFVLNSAPGPGNYRLPSDFGYYVNQKFYMKERPKTGAEPVAKKETIKTAEMR